MIDFALEAKCKPIDSGVGVKELARLISRLRHRQFGLLVTTSFLAEQAYKELRDDQHPRNGYRCSEYRQLFFRAVQAGLVPLSLRNALGFRETIRVEGG